MEALRSVIILLLYASGSCRWLRGFDVYTFSIEIVNCAVSERSEFFLLIDGNAG